MRLRRREKLPHPRTDLRLVYPAPEFARRVMDEYRVRVGARALADMRGEDDTYPGQSERFAAAAQRLARTGNW